MVYRVGICACEDNAISQESLQRLQERYSGWIADCGRLDGKFNVPCRAYAVVLDTEDKIDVENLRDEFSSLCIMRLENRMGLLPLTQEDIKNYRLMLQSDFETMKQRCSEEQKE
jgi:hypothetical protein